MEDGIPGGLQHRHKTCCEEGSRHGRRACMCQRWHHCGDVVFRTGGLVYDICSQYEIKRLASRLCRFAVVSIFYITNLDF